MITAIQRRKAMQRVCPHNNLSLDLKNWKKISRCLDCRKVFEDNGKRWERA